VSSTVQTEREARAWCAGSAGMSTVIRPDSIRGAAAVLRTIEATITWVTAGDNLSGDRAHLVVVAHQTGLVPIDGRSTAVRGSLRACPSTC
jgi:hypothetical protein